MNTILPPYYLVERLYSPQQGGGKQKYQLEVYAMNSDILKGNWKQFRGEMQKQWGKLTNDDMDVIEGEYDKLIGRIQERYGYSREEARREVDNYFERNPVR
jgi:uncharacterized protein YjbJ (UPF0337 family)